MSTQARPTNFHVFASWMGDTPTHTGCTRTLSARSRTGCVCRTRRLLLHIANVRSRRWPRSNCTTRSASQDHWRSAGTGSHRQFRRATPRNRAVPVRDALPFNKVTAQPSPATDRLEGLGDLYRLPLMYAGQCRHLVCRTGARGRDRSRNTDVPRRGAQVQPDASNRVPAEDASGHARRPGVSQPKGQDRMRRARGPDGFRK